MKRSRDDSGSGPSQKRPVNAGRGETSESAGPQPTQASTQRLTTDDALAYLKAVKEKFKDDKEKYEEFLECMKDFKAQRIDTAGVIGRVKDLFKGHRQLILGFNTFLPRGYEITMPPEEVPKKQPVEFDQAINYVNKIKTRFQNQEQVYKAFLEVLNMYRKGNKSITDVYREVAMLFEKHQDLLDEFTFFLPDHTHPPVQQQVARGGHAGVSRQQPVEKSSSATPPSRTIAVEKPLKKEKQSAASAPDGTTEREIEKGVKTEVEERKQFEKMKEKDKGKEKEKDKEKDIKEEKEERPKEDRVKKEEKEERDKDTDGQQDMMDMGTRPTKRSSARRADVLIKQHVEGRDVSSSAVPAASTGDEKRLPKAGSAQKDSVFFEKVKVRFRNKDTWAEFIKDLQMVGDGLLSKTELQDLVKDALSKHHDLMEGFNEIWARWEHSPGGVTEHIANLMPFLVRENDVSEASHKKKSEREQEKERAREPERARDRERDKSMPPPPREPPHRAPGTGGKEKIINKPISELDLSNSEKCTPSYRLLPKSYPRMISSHRTEIGNKVLNDNWVSVTSGSEDYSFKHMRKNQYEESLFRCEDDRFELDMLLESTIVTAKRVAELVENLHREKDKDGKPSTLTKIEDLSSINLRCVERIYGDHGLDIQELLKKNPAVALPVILQRLRQKQEEWSKCREEMNKVWAEVYSKNYHKSLDHRSFYFKQQDKKFLSARNMLADIKEINEKKKRDDDNTLLALAAGNRRPLIADMSFEYPDPSIHEDLYQIIKFSTEEVCNSSEQSEKLMKLWTGFLEPFLGVPFRPNGTEDAEEANKGKSVSTVPTPDQPSLGREPDESLQPSPQLQSASTTAGGSSRQGQVDNKDGGPLKADKGDKGDKGDSEPVKHRLGDNSHGAESSRNAARGGGHASEGAGRIPSVDDAHEPPVGEAQAMRREDRDDAGPSGDVRQSDLEPTPASVDTSLREVATDVGIPPRSPREEGELSPSPEAEEAPPPQRGRSNGSGGGSRKPMANGVTFSVGGKHRNIHGHGHVDDGDGDGDAHHHARGDEEGEDSGPSGGSSSVESDTNSENEHEDEEHDDEEEDDHEQLVKGESEGEAEGGGDADDAEGDGVSSPSLPDGRFSLCKPLAPHPGSLNSSVATAENGNHVFYANDAFYILFRLHEVLYERILSAKTNAQAHEHKWKSNRTDGTSLDPYSKFMELLYNLLDGTIENTKFEDDCRSLIGTQSYVLSTLDKLIYKLVKQLQTATTDEMSTKLLVLHSYEEGRAPGGFVDLVYHANACVLLHEDNIYRVEHKAGENATPMLTVQLMEGGPEKLDVPTGSIEPAFSDYLSQFLNSIPEPMTDRHHVFLGRNAKKATEESRSFSPSSWTECIRVLNGLECKISCSTSKVSYVLDTEDFFLRLKRKNRDSALPEGEGEGRPPLVKNTEEKTQRSHNFVSPRAKRFQMWAGKQLTQVGFNEGVS